MNVSYQWLHALAPDLDLTPRELAERLALLGAPVDEIVELGSALGDVVIARVEAVSPHPNADKLRLCTVAAGGEAPLQVVCGAPNVEVGGYYPFAPVGARLPGGTEIRAAKLRGEMSQGMLCSARELGLGRGHSGLMTLHGTWSPGARLLDALPELDDARLVVDVTPNRPELLSHLGVAREVAPGGAAGLRLPALPEVTAAPAEVALAGDSGTVDGVRIDIDDIAGCPRYMAAVIRGVRICPSPEWLATRLRAVGVRPISNVVDATNYVLFELGQPLHAFDLARLAGPRVRVRPPAAGERLVTLDGVERALEPGDLVIADAERAIALAGVMGGAESEVGEATTDLLIECARFDPRRIRATARRLGLSTDASYRFERGVDPEGLPRAMQRVCELIVAVAGGRVTGVVDCNAVPFEPRTIALRPDRVARLLGAPIPAVEIAALLTGIGFGVEDVDAPPLRVRIPGFRPDVEGEIDLIEEVARRRGYDSFPEELRPFRPTEIPPDPLVAVERRLRALFASRGFLEARVAAFSPDAPDAVPLLNPLSAEEGFLRRGLAPGLLRRAERNFAHGVRDVRLFQVGTVFRPGGGGAPPHEEVRVAAVFTGARAPLHWTGAADDFDAWDLKGLLTELAAEYVGASVRVGAAESELDTLLDGAVRLRLEVDDAGIGGGGQAAAGAVDAPAWAAPVYLLEARVPVAAVDLRERRYAPLPTHPAVERDLALLAPVALSAADLAATITHAAGPLLDTLFPFDVYAGKGMPAGMRSVAWRLRFRAAERTLTDAEVDAEIDRVLSAVAEAHDVRRR